MIRGRSTGRSRAYGTGLLLPIVVACSEPRIDEPKVESLTAAEATVEDRRDDALPAGVTLRLQGHKEVVVQPDDLLLPRWFGEQPIGVCLEAPVSIDTSQWRVRIGFGGFPEPALEALKPFAQAGSVLCFQRLPPPGLPSSRDLEVCATVVDELLDRQYRPPCFRAAYASDASEYDAAFGDFLELVGRRLELAPEPRLAEIDRLAAELDARGFPRLAWSLRLVAVHDLGVEGQDPAALEKRRRRLAEPPTWLDQPEATIANMQFTIESAVLELDAGRARRAWELLARADELARGVAADQRIAIVTKQAKILARMGAGREPVARLRASLGDCGRWPCRASLEAVGRQLLGWLLLIDPDADLTDLDEAEQILEAVVGDDHEQANRLINHAYLATRRKLDPTAMLDEARAILAALEPGARVRYLQAWADVVDGLAAMALGDAQRAIDRCRSAAHSSTRAAAPGWSCLGQVYRQRDELEAAASAFDQAVLHHALATPESASDRSLAPGWRVDDYYRAARVAIDLGDAEHAWRLLEALDDLSLDSFSTCEDASSDLRRRLESRRQSLRSELEWTEPPLALERRRQVEPVRQALLQSLDELQREILSLCRRPLRPAPVAADLRAFALPDEVLSLRRSAGGSVTVTGRTAVSRRAIRDLIDRLSAAQASGLDDAAWRDLAQPLSEALLPSGLERLGEITRFALHGVLQRVPVEALPVDVPGKARWLGELTTVVLRPAFVEAGVLESEQSSAVPLFVVDPRRNLRSGPATRDFYRQQFPAARVLYGSEATGDAVRSALPGASFFHVDAHGTYDPAFPELSGLQMADVDLTLADFASSASPRYFVNLSGCHTGGATESGDSGRYGLAGAFARAGTRWVIANRSAVQDQLARDFNEIFYQQILSGDSVPMAFRAAAAVLRQSYDAAMWSNLMLLGAGDEGQNRPGGD